MIKTYSSDHLKKNLGFFFTYNNKEILGAQSGLPFLDSCTEGFFGLVGLTGEPGTGKTSLAVQTTVFNAFDLYGKPEIICPVLYISLEVNKDLLITKIISYLIGVPLKKILKGGMNFEESRRFFSALLEVNNNKNLSIIDASEVSFSLIESQIKDLKADFFKNNGEEKEVLVVLDYLNIFHSLPKLERKEALTDNSKVSIQMKEFITIKNMTKSNWLIILAKNKKGYKTQDMGSIKGSGDLEYGFETIMSLAPPDEEFPISDFAPDEENGFEIVNVVLKLLKARWESTNKIIPLFFNGQKNKFFEPKNT